VHDESEVLRVLFVVSFRFSIYWWCYAIHQ
jgi:hypothetical protein